MLKIGLQIRRIAMTTATWLVLLLKDRSCVHQVCLTCEASIEPCLHFTDALVLWYFHSLPPPLTLHTIWRNVDFYVPRDCVQRDIQGLEITVPLDKWCNYTETAIKWTWLLCCFKFRNRREERDNSRVLRSCSRVKEGRGGGGGGACFAVLYFQSRPVGTTVCVLTRTVWMWKCRFCFGHSSAV